MQVPFFFMVVAISSTRSSKPDAPVFLFSEVAVADKINELIANIEDPGTLNEEECEECQDESILGMEIEVEYEEDIAEDLGIDTEEVLQLLMPTLKTASCSARCSRVFVTAPNSFNSCNNTCHSLQQQSWQSVCEHNCTFSCHVACAAVKTTVSVEDSLELTASLEGCSLFWTATGTLAHHLQFVVVARDKNGMLYQIGTTQQHSIPLPLHLLEKASAVLLIAVDPNGVTGLRTVAVEEGEARCLHQQSKQVPYTADMPRPASVSSAAVILVMTLSGLLIVLVILMLVLLGMYTRQQRRLREEEKVWKTDEGFEYNLYPGHFQKAYVSSPITL